MTKDFFLLWVCLLGLAVVGFLCGRLIPSASASAPMDVEFTERDASTDGAGRITKILHLKTGTCLVYYKWGYGAGMSQVPREVCQ